jgi:hypothetical protein
MGSEAQQDAAMVSGIGTAAQKALLDGAIDQFDSAVVLEQHARGNVGNGGVELFRHAPDALQQLILLGAQSGARGGQGGEVEEFAELETKLREAAHLRAGEGCWLIVGGVPMKLMGGGESGRIFSKHHVNIVARYIVLRVLAGHLRRGSGVGEYGARIGFIFGTDLQLEGAKARFENACIFAGEEDFDACGLQA